MLQWKMSSKKVSFKLSNLKKKTPEFWVKVGNTVLAVSAGMPMVINQFTFGDGLKDNLIALSGLVGLTAKALTMFFTEEEKEPEE